MSISKHDSDLFLSDKQLEVMEQRNKNRKNNLGDPIRTNGKILFMDLISSTKTNAKFLVCDARGYCTLYNDKVVLRLKGHRGPVTCAKMFNDFIYTAGWDKTIREFNLDGVQQREFLHHSDYVKCMEIKNGVIYTGSTDKTVCRFDFVKKDYFIGHKRQVEGLKVKDFLWTCSSDTFVKKWCLETKSCLQEFQHETSVLSISWDSLLVTGSADFKCIEWTQKRTLQHPDLVRVVLTTNDYIVTGCRDGKVRIFYDFELIQEFEGHYDEVTGLCVLGDFLYSTSLDGTIRKWRIE